MPVRPPDVSRLAGPRAGRALGPQTGRLTVVIATVAASLAVLLPATAQPPPPATLLGQLGDETQRMYARARLGMVRVRLPTPPWLARQNQQLMRKWGTRLDPAVRDQLARALAGLRPTTAPGGDPPLAWPPASAVGPLAAAGRPLTVTVVAPPSRVLIATGLLLDAAGDAVLPLYLDRADLPPGATLPALTGDGRPTVAAFVGSDRLTNLTVVKLADPGDHPTVLAADGPADAVAAAPPGSPPDGSLALVVAADGSAHLTVWTAASADTGLVLRPDGTVAGFGFADDFLPLVTARPIVDQLIATGTVHRPTLGVGGLPVRRSELMFDPALPGGPAAVLVTAVDPASVADRAGIRPADLILSVAGQSVGPRTFAAVIAARRGPTTVRVRRGSQTVELTVDLRVE